MKAADFSGVTIERDQPTVLFADGSHQIFWLGIDEETAFRCNVYLIRDGEAAILVDPGNRSFFPAVRARVEQIMDPRHVTGMILCHQDPDVAASMVDWLDLNPAIKVYSTSRTHVLLPHYGRPLYPAVDVADQSTIPLPSGGHLRTIEAPFLHFPGAFVTYDPVSRFLFSGDIWAALDMNWRLVVDSFEEHVLVMDLFHLDYMACNVAARGFVRRIEGIDIRAILPQHGSIIGAEHVPAALDYLRSLRCGLDIVYADLD
ncbi:MAG TPA: MBL fold metallo-hydrolase [Rhodospirillales bacterium]|nr:MBL fold metallo-hydrolase [Rhodospirillales bacterium]